MSHVEQRLCPTCGLALWQVDEVYGARRWTCTTAVRWLDAAMREDYPGCGAVRWSCPVCGQCSAVEVGSERHCTCGYRGPLPDESRTTDGVLPRVHVVSVMTPSVAPLVVVKREPHETTTATTDKPAPRRPQKRAKAAPGQGSLF